MNLGDFFSPGELAAWSDQRVLYHLLYFTSIGVKLFFLATVAFSSIHLVIRRLAQHTARWLYARQSLAAAAKNLLPLHWVLRTLERFGLGGKDAQADRFQWLVDSLYPVYLLLLWTVLVLPLQFFSDFVIEHELGLSTTTLWRWWTDWFKSLLLVTAPAALLGLGVFGLARRLSRSWWLWLWGAVVGALVLWSMLTPFRASVFFKFTPLPEGQLSQNLKEMMEKAGFGLERVEVVDTSKRSRRVNAFIMGAGPTKRVVLSDNLVVGFHPREIRVAVAHEAGHDLQQQPVRSFLVSSLGAFLFLALFRLVLWWFPKRKRLGLQPGADPAALPLALLVMQLLFLINSPLSAWLDRQNEKLADQEALRLTEDPVAYCSLIIRLARVNQEDVDPPAWSRWYFRHHPTTAERLESGFSWANRNGIRIGRGALPLPLALLPPGG